MHNGKHLFKQFYMASAAACLMLTLGAPSAQATDVLNVKTIGTDLARDIANETVKVCTDKGYSITAVVTDRSGQIMAALRSEYAAIETMEIAAGKARGALMAGIPTSELRANRPELAANLMHLDSIMMMDGGLPISVGGSRIGAVGVSGAPGGDIDEACAQDALDALFDRIEFAQ